MLLVHDFDIIVFNVRPCDSDTKIILFDDFWAILGDVPNVRADELLKFTRTDDKKDDLPIEFDGSTRCQELIQTFPDDTSRFAPTFY